MQSLGILRGAGKQFSQHLLYTYIVLGFKV